MVCRKTVDILHVIPQCLNIFVRLSKHWTDFSPAFVQVSLFEKEMMWSHFTRYGPSLFFGLSVMDAVNILNILYLPNQFDLLFSRNVTDMYWASRKLRDGQNSRECLTLSMSNDRFALWKGSKVLRPVRNLIQFESPKGCVQVHLQSAASMGEIFRRPEMSVLRSGTWKC